MHKSIERWYLINNSLLSDINVTSAARPGHVAVLLIVRVLKSTIPPNYEITRRFKESN